MSENGGGEKVGLPRDEETFGVMGMFVILITMIVWVHTHVKSDQTTCFKYVSLFVFQLYLNGVEK